MSNWRVIGGLDDPSLVDGEGKFIGMNLRDPLDQLSPGYVGLSKNGRIEGSWEARRGIELKSGALTTSANPLRLPFLLYTFYEEIASAERTSNVIEVTLTDAIGLEVGTEGYITIGDPDSGVEPILGVSPGSYYATITYAGNPARFTFEHVGSDGVLSIGSSPDINVWTKLHDDAVVAIWGSCVYSNPRSNLEESIILAASSGAKLVSLSGYAVSDIAYPFGLSINEEVDLLQAFDRIYLFRDGERTLEYWPVERLVVSGSYVSATGVVTLEVKNHGLSVGDLVDVFDVGFSATPTTADPNGMQTVTAVVDVDHFSYDIASGSGDETYTPNTGGALPQGFTFVPGGPYTQPQTFSVAGDKYGVSSGLVRVTVSGNTTVKVGDFVSIRETDITHLSSLVGNFYEVTSASATDIYFYAPVSDLTYGGGSALDSLQIGSRFTVGGGFMHMPGPPWGVYFQRRLWVPYFYENGGTNAAPTYTDKEQRDQIAASDILDGDTFDQIYSQFRITGGVADYLVGMYPFFNDYLMIFNRNSVHLVKGTQGGLEDTEVHELTREVGCLARKTIAGQGNQVFFLSDNGVYAVEFQDEYNLRGTKEPLSRSIQPLIDRINPQLASESVGRYFNNRYYLAVPLDSSVNANDATGNNSVLVYNMLNSAWESLDTYGDGDLNIRNLLVGQESERNDLYLVNDVGGLHLSESKENAVDVYSIDPLANSLSAAVDYEMQTRGFNFGNLDRKKFHRGQVQVQSNKDNVTDLDFLISTEDPDSGETVADIYTLLDDSYLPANESGTMRFRLGNPRGTYGSLTIKRKIVGSEPVGRPKIISVKLDATVTNRQTISHQ